MIQKLLKTTAEKKKRINIVAMDTGVPSDACGSSGLMRLRPTRF